MGYFANGTEGDFFRESYCGNCKNWRDIKDGRGYGCPIMDLHFAYGYELANSKSKAKKILDSLIPIDNKCMNKCTMFLKRSKEEL